MGKKAVPIAHLQNDQNRRNTFKKRLVGLMKKVHDLSILCDVQIAVIVIDENKEIFPYTNEETIEAVWNQYFVKDEETKLNRLRKCKEVLEIETNKMDIACQAKKKNKQEHEPLSQHIGLHCGIPQNVGPHQNISQTSGAHQGTFQSNGVKDQPTCSDNSNRLQYQIHQGKTTSSMPNLQIFDFNSTMQERNSNDESNYTNGMNQQNTNQASDVTQIPYYGTSGRKHPRDGYHVGGGGGGEAARSRSVGGEGPGRGAPYQPRPSLRNPLGRPIGGSRQRVGCDVDETQRYQTNRAEPPRHPTIRGDGNRPMHMDVKHPIYMGGNHPTRINHTNHATRMDGNHPTLVDGNPPRVAYTGEGPGQEVRHPHHHRHPHHPHQQSVHNTGLQHPGDHAISSDGFEKAKLAHTGLSAAASPEAETSAAAGSVPRPGGDENAARASAPTDVSSTRPLSLEEVFQLVDWNELDLGGLSDDFPPLEGGEFTGREATGREATARAAPGGEGSGADNHRQE